MMSHFTSNILFHGFFLLLPLRK